MLIAQHFYQPTAGQHWHICVKN